MADARVTSEVGFTDFGDQTIKNVTKIQLKEIVSDDETSVSLNLGTDAGDDFKVATDKLVVEGNTGRIGIGTATPASTVEIEGSSGDLILEIDNNVSNSANFQIQNGAGNARVDLVMNDGSASTTLTMKGQQVGIMDTDPSYGLDVNGTVRAVGAATFDSNISCSGILDVQHAVNGTGMTLNSSAANSRILFNGSGATNGTSVGTNNDDFDIANGDGAGKIIMSIDGTAGLTVEKSGTDRNVVTAGEMTIGDAAGDDHTVNGPMTFNHNAVLAEASSLSIATPALATANLTATGVTATMLAGAAIAAFEAVCISTTSGKIVKADASVTGTMPVIGIATEAFSGDDETGTVLLQGFVRYDTWAWGTIGGVIYASETGGDLTQTAPTTSGAFVQALGVALTADVVYFNPSLTMVEVA